MKFEPNPDDEKCCICGTVDQYIARGDGTDEVIGRNEVLCRECWYILSGGGGLDITHTVIKPTGIPPRIS